MCISLFRGLDMGVARFPNLMSSFSFSFTEGRPLAVFTDKQASMLRNEVKDYLEKGSNKENWLFMRALTQLEIRFKKLEKATNTNNNVEITRLQEIIDRDLEKIRDDFLQSTTFTSTSKKSYTHTVNLSGKITPNLLAAIGTQDMPAIATGLTRAAIDVFQYIRSGIRDVPGSQERLTRAENLTLAAKETAVRIPTFIITILNMDKQQQAQAKKGFYNKLSLKLEDKENLPPSNTKIFTHANKNFQAAIDILTELQNTINNDLLLDPHLNVEQFEVKLNNLLQTAKAELLKVAKDIRSQRYASDDTSAAVISLMSDKLEDIRTSASEYKEVKSTQLNINTSAEEGHFTYERNWPLSNSPINNNNATNSPSPPHTPTSGEDDTIPPPPPYSPSRSKK